MEINTLAFNHSFWAGKKVLVTGHTGFKGSWLTIILQHLGAKVSGISLSPENTQNLFDLSLNKSSLESHICDIRNYKKLKKIISHLEPEIVFHMAAQPLVRASYFDPLETFSTNYMGTANILESFRGLHDLRVAVMVTTDKVYRENHLKKNYLETDELGGWDPYSASKASSEILIDSYKKSFFNDGNLRIAVARAGNVIGGGDWSKDRLFPDLIRAQESREVLVIRHPESTRPWQHVLECLQAYTKLAEKLHNSKEFQGEYNFGPDTNSQLISVKDIVMMARNYYQDLRINFESDQNVFHEANNLGLNTKKAKEILGVASIWSVEESIKKTLDWYKSFGRGVDARACCLSDIQKLEQDYEAL